MSRAVISMSGKSAALFAAPAFFGGIREPGCDRFQGAALGRTRNLSHMHPLLRPPRPPRKPEHLFSQSRIGRAKGWLSF